MIEIKLRNKKFTYLILVFFYFYNPILADDIFLKSGKTLTNVKTKITTDAIEVRSEDGKVIKFSKKEVKSLKVRSVVWKPPKIQKTEEEKILEQQEEESRVAEASIKGDEFIPRDPDDEINPWSNFALGLIPGYSGMYRTNDTWTAISFSVLETFALFYTYDVWQAKQTTLGFGDPTTGGLILAGSLIPAAPGGSNSYISVFGFYTESASTGYSGALSGFDYVKPGQPATTSQRYSTMKSTSIGILGMILFVDGVMSFFAADSWNEGTYGGEKSEDFIRPTTPMSRTLRSAFLPGWGQVYGGDKWKGYSWMVGGIALIGNVGRAEAAVSAAKREYRDSPGALGGIIGPVFLPNRGINSTQPERLSSYFLLSYLLSEPSYQKLESAVADRNNAWTFYGAYWLINLVDAYFFSGQNLENKSGKVSFFPSFQYQPVISGGNQVRWESLLEMTVVYHY
ncbi:DUF5683 domain-containing protein [Leptospira sp. GIMC2001]|uniref:DUF5683 domain-containing protein n=1 Tax=Leptospira sp. GIMC2001 TaxID=1513297 RepID=UPI00234A3A3F|nr:DUF5683 domain-containing protein [Leptospira sp. GIMC2001]WCL49626.1 DUF5683 domain-containing protein [Leptospira sp. GIMC2001]